MLGEAGAADRGGTHTHPGTPAAAPAEQLSDNLFFVAASPEMLRIRAELQQVARIDVPVLCLGESGTGKEVIAHLIHRLSERASRTFLKVNCAALPADLLESELFGYEAGAFTGAIRSKPGRFELCTKGTIFLDEIAEMPTPLQAKLLHVLQDHEFARLGGCSRIKVDVRVIAATNVDVVKAIAANRLREDLYYRLNTFVFRLPPLRERLEDIPVLFDHYLQHFAAQYQLPPVEASPELLDCARRYPWPGNVRELENLARRLLIFGDEQLVLRELNGARKNGKSAAASGNLKATVGRIKDEVELEAIRRALQRTRWNRKAAARLLGISYAALLYKIRHYRLDQEAAEESE